MKTTLLRRRTSDRQPIRPDRERPTVVLACSPGGHLQQMLALRSAWGDCDRVWISLRAPDSEALLADEEVVWAHGPTNRSVSALLRNVPIVWRTIRRVDPDAVLSTGAALALPLMAIARLRGRRAVYVESFTRTRSLSLTGKLVYPLATTFFVQWPATESRLRRVRYEGSVL